MDIFKVILYGGNDELLKLIKTNPNLVNKINDCGWEMEKPIHVAVRNNKIAFVDVLLKNGADINACNVRNEQPLHMAVRNKYYNLKA